MRSAEDRPIRRSALPAAKVGIVPLVFVNDDLPDLTPFIEPMALVAEIGRLGFRGTQLSRGLPRGPLLRPALEKSGLVIAEVYAAPPCSEDGPPAAAREQAMEAIQALREADGEVLVFTYDLSAGRIERAGRASTPGTPQLTASGWRAALDLLDEVAERVDDLGRRLVYHPHLGTFVETPDEVDRLMQESDPSRVGLCLDVGHYTAGGGDPVTALQRYGTRVRHLHMKDVDATVLAALRTGQIPDFHDALRRRLFTELGEGVLDLPAIVRELANLEYDGWLMVEQDTTWRSPAESAAIGRAVLASALDSEAFRRLQPVLAP